MVLDNFSSSNCSDLNPDFLDREPLLDSSFEPRTLWLMCTDSNVDSIAQRIESCRDVIMVRRPGASPEILVRSAAQTGRRLDEYVIEDRVRSIIICGHSQCCSLPGYCDNHSHPKSGPLPLLFRASNHNARIEAAKKEVVLNMHFLRTSRDYRNLSKEFDLRITGLFYLVETKSFLVWSSTQSSFVPLEKQKLLG